MHPEKEDKVRKIPFKELLKSLLLFNEFECGNQFHCYFEIIDYIDRISINV